MLDLSAVPLFASDQPPVQGSAWMDGLAGYGYKNRRFARCPSRHGTPITAHEIAVLKTAILDEIYDSEFEGEYIDISLLTPSGCELALYRSASNMLAARVGFHPFAEEFSGVLAEFEVFGSKCGGKMAIDVQLADHFARHKNRHDDFGLGLERAG